MSMNHWVARQWPLAAALAIAAIAVAPSLRTGYFGDDGLNSTLPAVWKIRGISPTHDTVLEIRSWVVNAGRFNPMMHVWKNGWYYAVRDLAFHKWLVFGMVGLNLVLLYRLLRALAQPREAAAFACLLAAILVQFRTNADPVLGFNGMMQFVAGLVLGSLLALCAYRRTGRARWLVASLGLHLAGCLTYECCVFLCAAHAALLYADGRGRLALRAAPFFAAGAAVVLTNLALRFFITIPPESMYKMVLDPPEVVWATFQRQCLAALPLTYGGYDPHKLMNARGFVFDGLDYGWVGVLTLVAAAGLAYRLPQSPRSIFLPLLGAGLLVLPAVPVAVCSRYQGELVDGMGHLPVYLQMFGVALLVTSAVPWLTFWGRRLLVVKAPVAFALGASCAVVAAGHYASNAATIGNLDPMMRMRRQMEGLSRVGLLDPVPAGATLLADPFCWEMGWHGPAFYLTHARKRLDLQHVSTPADLAEYKAKGTAKAGAWRLIYSQVFEKEGVIGLGQFRPAGDPTLPLLDVHLRRLAFRVRAHDGTPIKPLPFLLGGQNLEGAPILVKVPDVTRLVRQTSHWAIYELTAPVVILEGTAWVGVDPTAR